MVEAITKGEVLPHPIIKTTLVKDRHKVESLLNLVYIQCTHIMTKQPTKST